MSQSQTCCQTEMLGRVHQHQDPWVLSQNCCHLDKACNCIPLSPNRSLYCSGAQEENSGEEERRMWDSHVTYMSCHL